jgi:hypothetical protein
LHLTRYVAKIAPRGFQWLYLDNDGWRLVEPPDDWGVPDDWDDEPPLADKFFLSAPEAAWSQWDEKPWQKGTLKSEPDLYAKIASMGESPGSILNYANRYGFLGPTVEVRRTEQMIWPEYHSQPGFAPSDSVAFYAEPASRWLGLGGWLSHEITKMEKVGWESGVTFLKWMNPESRLDYRVERDSATGRLKGELVASSLAELLMVQLVSAGEADVRHRRCEHCRSFFPVRPGLRRPEKKYCSDACRMKAYRARRGAVRSGKVVMGGPS